MGYLWAMTLPGLVIGLTALAVADRIRQRAQGPRIFGPARDSSSLGAADFDELGAAFSAGKRSELDIRASALLLREQDGEGSAPFPRSVPRDGVVRLRLKKS